MMNFDGMPNMGMEAWMQHWREAMAGLAGPWSGGAASTAWPRWPGSPAQWSMPGAFQPGTTMPGLDAGPFGALFEQLSTLAQGQWQQLARRFTPGAAQADQFTHAWREFMQSLPSSTAAAMPGMGESAIREMLSTPQVGPMREHVERWQQAMLAQLDYQQAASAFSAQLGDIMKLAVEHFGKRIAARTESGKTAKGLREVFDEWIEAGEQAWAERASRDAFVAALGAYTNAQMRVRAAQAEQVNRIAQSMGLPTREEVNRDHKRIAQLEREVRRLQRELMTTAPTQSANAATRTVATAAVNPAPIKPASAQSAPVKPEPVKHAPAKAATARTKSTSKSAKPPKRNQSTVTTAKSATPAASKLASTAIAKRNDPVAGRRSKPTSFPMVTAPRAIGRTAAKPQRSPSTNKRIQP